MTTRWYSSIYLNQSRKLSAPQEPFLARMSLKSFLSEKHTKTIIQERQQQELKTNIHMSHTVLLLKSVIIYAAIRADDYYSSSSSATKCRVYRKHCKLKINSETFKTMCRWLKISKSIWYTFSVNMVMVYLIYFRPSLA